MTRKISMNANENISIDDAFKNFINEKIQCELKEETIKDYENAWRLFQKYLHDKQITSLKDINEKDIVNYISYTREQNENIKDTSINTYLRNIRVILYYFMDNQYMEIFKINLLRISRNVKEPYTDEEIEKLIKKPDIKKCDFSEYRNWVLVCYFIATGNRSKTVRNIKIKDVDIKNRMIHLGVVKNGVPYDIPIPDILYPILKEYMKIRGGKSEDYLFCTQYGGQLSADGLKTVIKRYNMSRGVEKSSIHLFRHYFAKNWILNEGSSKKLQFALGHSTSTMVDNYLNIYGKDLKQDFDMYNPLGNFKDKMQKTKIIVKRNK